MADLIEKDPQIAAVVDKATGRDLLDASNPNPLSIDLTGGKVLRFELGIKNGEEGLIDLAISADEVWLAPEKNRLTLVGSENGAIVFEATPEGDNDFANILFSWEGINQSLCQSVMVMRRRKEPQETASASGQTAAPASPAAPSPRRAKRTQAVEVLKKFIDGCGGPDKFIDVEEEYKIFRKGGELELTLTEVESILNRCCGDGGWTRQTRLTEKLTAMLHEATKDDGVIDKNEYDHILSFAVKRLMPRKDADEHCVTLILDNAWKVKEGVFDKWFTKKRKQYGL